MRCQTSLKGLRSALVAAGFTVVSVGLTLAAQWLAPAPPVAAAPPAQVTLLPFILNTMTPTPTAPLSGPPRRAIRPITATPPAVLVTPATPLPTPLPIILTPVTPQAVNVQQVGPVMLAEAERLQSTPGQGMEFNPDAALQKRIFADGLVPNSAEFRTTVGGVEFGAQRAESLRSNLVRVYFVVVPDFANVSFVQRLNAQNVTQEAILAAGEAAQVIRFNPDAALQKRMFGDGFVPNSSEFSQVVDGVRYIGQRGERLDTGEVRVYFVRDGDFATIFFFRRSG